MPVWQNIRRLAFSGAVQGVQEPGPLDVLTPAQAVQVVDDASIAVAPPRVPHGVAATIATGGAVGEHNGLEVQGRAAGIVVEWITSASALNEQLDVWRDDAQVTTLRNPIASVQTLGVPDGEGPDSGLFDVRVAAAARPADRAIGLSLGPFQGQQLLNWYVAPGERLFFADVADNNALVIWISFREVPVRLRA